MPIPKISRRGLLAAGLALPLAGAGWSVVEPGLVVVRRQSLTFPRWPASHGTLRLVFLTDLHVGCPHVSLDKTAAIVEQTNALRPDVILLGGDFVIQNVLGGRFVPPEDIGRALAGLRAPRGVYSVLGNHDWWLDGKRVGKALEAVGIEVLEDRAVAVDGGPPFWLAGMGDHSTRRPDVAKTLAQIQDDAPVLALAHDPATFAEMTERPLVTMCGHTHGGQINLPFYGPVTNASRAPLRWTYGHIVEAGKELFVSAGIGTSVLPIRLNQPPEIVLIEIGHGEATAA